MAIQVIAQQSGPLPITVNFQALTDEPVYLEINGSIYCEATNQMIGISVNLDGADIGTAQIYSTVSETHQAVVPAYIPIQLAEGQHTLTLSPALWTTSGFNDFYTAVIHY